MIENNTQNKLKIFFSYSYKKTAELKPIFVEISTSLGMIPIFADEVPEMGLTIYEKVRSLLTSSEIIVFDISNSPIHLIPEFSWIENLDKPIIIVSQRQEQKYTVLLDSFFSKYNINYYRSSSELFKLLHSQLNRIKKSYFSRLNLEKNEVEQTISESLNKSIKENILVLGKDSDAEILEKMNKIKKKLIDLKYKPVYLREVPDIPHKSFEGKMITVGAYCRFIIVEDSKPSGHIDELRICANSEFITVAMRETGSISTFMQSHYSEMYTFINRICYKYNVDKKDKLCSSIYATIEDATEESVKWCETKIKYFEDKFKNTR